MNNFRIRLDRSANFFLENFLSFVKVTAAPFVILEAADYYFYTETGWRELLYLHLSNIPVFFRGMSLTAEEFGVLALVLIVFALMIVFLYQIAFFKTVEYLHGGKKITFFMSYRLGWDCLRGYVFVIMLVLMRAFLWSLLFIIPGFIAGCRYVFSFLAYVIDNKKGKDALAYSQEIMENNIKKFLGNIAGMLIIVVGFYACVFSILEWIFRVHENCRVTVKAVTGELLQDFGLALCVGYILIFAYFLYHDLKAMKKVNDDTTYVSKAT